MIAFDFFCVLMMCLAILLFYRALVKNHRNVYEHYKNQRKEILVLGDSHSNVFNYINKRSLLPNTYFNVITVNGATAQGACNPNSKTNALTIFKNKLRSQKKHDRVMIMLGEVDCGFVIWYRKEKYDTSIETQLNNSIDNLFEFIDTYVRKHFTSHQIVVIGANLPTLQDHRNIHSEVANLRKEVKASLVDRTKLTLEYNNILKRKCADRGYEYIDIVKHTLDPRIGTVNTRFLHENENDHHFSQIKTAPLWVNLLYDKKITIL